MAEISIRFVAGRGLAAAVIRAAQLGYAFTHAEALVADGYIGAHLSGGVLFRPVGYDAGQFKAERFVTIPATPAQAERFTRFLGEQAYKPYDRRAIVDFALAALGVPLRIAPPGAWSDPGRWECAALMLAGLIAAGLVDPDEFADRRHVTPECLAFALGGIARRPAAVT